MMNYWKIGEKEAVNGMSILHIVIDGQEVETITSGSVKYLSSIADNLYKVKYNQHSLSGWKYTIA